MLFSLITTHCRCEFFVALWVVSPERYGPIVCSLLEWQLYWPRPNRHQLDLEQRCWLFWRLWGICWLWGRCPAAAFTWIKWIVGSHPKSMTLILPRFKVSPPWFFRAGLWCIDSDMVWYWEKLIWRSLELHYIGIIRFQVGIPKVSHYSDLDQISRDLPLQAVSFVPRTQNP